ncbi:unnamed protein product, partial [Symbiodinium sp. CCMP2456]
ENGIPPRAIQDIVENNPEENGIPLQAIPHIVETNPEDNGIPPEVLQWTSDWADTYTSVYFPPVSGRLLDEGMNQLSDRDSRVGIVECGGANTIGKLVAEGDLAELPPLPRFSNIPLFQWTARGKSIVSNAVPKKGKLRSVQKRPAAITSTTRKDVQYVREKCAVGPRGQRKDQTKWKRTIRQLLRASDKEIINVLIADKFIPKWEGKTCPTCSEGTLSKLRLDPRGCFRHRCSHRNCHSWMNPHHLHPLFTEGQGPQAQSLKMQAAHILFRLHRIPRSKIHFLLDVNHKTIEDMEKKICELRQEYVEKKEKDIVFGDGKSWKDIETDDRESCCGIAK